MESEYLKDANNYLAENTDILGPIGELEKVGDENRLDIQRAFRVEGRTRNKDITEALRLRVHDPLWMLARQWQMGEFRGNNAGTAMSVRCHVSEVDCSADPIEPVTEQINPNIDLMAKVESAVYLLDLVRQSSSNGAAKAKDLRRKALAKYPIDWDNIQTSLAIDSESTARGEAALNKHMRNYITTYRGKIFDGETVYNALKAGRGTELELSSDIKGTYIQWFEAKYKPTSPVNDHWQDEDLCYEVESKVGDMQFKGDRYQGGRLSWYTFDYEPGGKKTTAAAPVAAPVAPKTVATKIPASPAEMLTASEKVDFAMAYMLLCANESALKSDLTTLAQNLSKTYPMVTNVTSVVADVFKRNYGVAPFDGYNLYLALKQSNTFQIVASSPATDEKLTVATRQIATPLPNKIASFQKLQPTTTVVSLNKLEGVKKIETTASNGNVLDLLTGVSNTKIHSVLEGVKVAKASGNIVTPLQRQPIINSNAKTEAALRVKDAFIKKVDDALAKKEASLKPQPIETLQPVVVQPVMPQPVTPQVARPTRREVLSLPTPATFASAPNKRLWQMEDHKVFMGNSIEQQSEGNVVAMKYATMYSNDWMLFPLQTQIGRYINVDKITVIDTFGDCQTIDGSCRAGNNEKLGRFEEPWQVFTNSDAGNRKNTSKQGLYYVPQLAATVEGKPIEEVRILRDEMANMVWAVEERVPDGCGDTLDANLYATQLSDIVADNNEKGLPKTEPQTFAFAQDKDVEVQNPNTSAKYRYLLQSTVPFNWIPFVPQRLKTKENSQSPFFMGGREMVLRRGKMPCYVYDGEEGSGKFNTYPVRPLGSIMRPEITLGADGKKKEAPMVIHEEAIQATGIRLTKNYQRARWLSGKSYTWLGLYKRQTQTEASSGLVFDELQEK